MSKAESEPIRQFGHGISSERYYSEANCDREWQLGRNGVDNDFDVLNPRPDQSVHPFPTPTRPTLDKFPQRNLGRMKYRNNRFRGLKEIIKKTNILQNQVNRSTEGYVTHTIFNTDGELREEKIDQEYVDRLKFIAGFLMTTLIKDGYKTQVSKIREIIPWIKPVIRNQNETVLFDTEKLPQYVVVLFPHDYFPFSDN